MSIDRILRITLYTLLASVIISLIYVFIDHTFNVATFVSVASTFAIAILTVTYVSTTSKQLAVMQQQISEGIKSRELAYQPLPIIRIKKFKLEKPRFYYSPPDDTHCVLSRYFADFEIKNSGNSPAVCVSVVGTLCCYDFASKEMSVLSSEIQDKAPQNISVLGEKEKRQQHDLMFINDMKGDLVFGLRNSKKTPIVLIETFYKNILGACFLSKQHFTLHIKDKEQGELLGNWHTNISSFESRFANELATLRKIQKTNKKEWDELFEKVKNSFASLIIGDDQEISVNEIADGLSITVINESQYSEGIKKTYWGKILS